LNKDCLTVRFGPRSYDIHFGTGILSDVGAFCQALALGANVAVVTNQKVGSLCSSVITDSLTSAGFSVCSVEIPDGESYKNSETLNSIYDFLINAGLNRESFLIALGGGVVGDITGFAASTYLRGIPFVQIPTSLLAQVDSSVGGKTGINHPLGKNLIGSFYQPRMVLIDNETLATLPEREYLSGLAEVVKYGVVCDSVFFDFLSENREKLLNRDSACLLTVIRSSCALKASVVEHDERECGYRAVLNYGHTFAHAIESLAGYSAYLHGEAVSMGMVQSAVLSEKMGYARAEDTARIIALLTSLHLPVDLAAFSKDAYRQVMLRDKKVRDGGINFVFNKRIGASVIEKTIDWDFLLHNVSR
jgi:3-dehydroquinate synthase